MRALLQLSSVARRSLAGSVRPLRNIRLVSTTKLFIDGQAVESQATEWIDVIDPATQSIVTRVPQTTAAELEAAASSAQTAFEKWRRTTVGTRQRVMLDLQQLIRDDSENLMRIMVGEQGKVLADARGDVHRGLQVVEAMAGLAPQLMGHRAEVAADMATHTVREPLGVLAGVCPFNFPALIPLWMIPVALATGNTLLLKPSERAPGAAMRLAHLCTQAGVPPGVLNVVHGSRPTVDFLTADQRVKAVSFVGGDRAGRHIFERATAHGQRCQANLGAKNHAVVMPDASREQALAAITGAAFGAAGQRCMALSVAVFVGAAADWIPELAERAARLRVDGGLEPGADLGPLISVQALQRAHDLIQTSVEQGAHLALDGRGVRVAKYPRGNFLGPTVVDHVTPAMACYTEEVFAPVLSCVRVASLDEALALVNANRYGNGAAIFTRSGAAAARFQADVGAGQVGVNVAIPVPLPMFSFTGNRGSFLGDTNFYGPGGVAFCTQLKTVTSLWRREDAEEIDHASAVHMPTLH
ncbi:aldehyde dehydrogenase (NADP(+)) ald6 [Coemansia thaxteri]|nr:aldehyde dehydrogenase (NADP(+)) ald6 [Coemansia thaxteri]KAJ2471784.1 aldehyde dehydrogenase (NADP(+)) ald6 [Coemansia sp. RSA 2322]